MYPMYISIKLKTNILSVINVRSFHTNISINALKFTLEIAFSPKCYSFMEFLIIINITSYSDLIREKSEERSVFQMKVLVSIDISLFSNNMRIQVTCCLHPFFCYTLQLNMINPLFFKVAEHNTCGIDS